MGTLALSADERVRDVPILPRFAHRGPDGWSNDFGAAGVVPEVGRGESGAASELDPLRSRLRNSLARH